MRHTDLLDTPLKQPFLDDLFETYDVDVIYGYDRDGEDGPDEYHAAVNELGLRFVFDHGQRLRVLFVQPVETDSWDPFAPLEESVSRFATKADAAAHAEAQGLPTAAGRAELAGRERDWIRFEYPTHTAHYEFVDEALSLITLQSRSG